MVGMLAAFLFLIVLLSQFSNGRSTISPQEIIQGGASSVVLVTTLDPTSSPAFNDMISQNRMQYAALHGYVAFLPNITDYPHRVPKVVHSESDKTQAPAPIPSTWSKIPAVRHAMALYPHSLFFFYLDRSAIITNPELSVEEHITNKARLESLMIPDHPVVPPESVIHTLHARRSEYVDFIVTQDHEGLSQQSFIVRRGEWSKYFLDAWYDPLYRSYNFQRAEGHALEHLVQWHGTVLARMAIIPQRIMNSYTKGQESEQYADGDFVAHSKGCDSPNQPTCESALKPLFDRFRAALTASA